MADHLTADVLEHYVIGALEPSAAREVEAHVAACEACAASLRREARLELGLHEVAGSLAPPEHRVVALPRRWRPVAAAALAFAAGIAGVLVVQQLAGSREGEPRLVRCEDPRSVDDCVAKARFDGLVSLVPGAGVDVPRYDEQPAVQKRGTP